MQQLCLFCVDYEAVWTRTNGQFLTGCWLLFALFFKGLSSLAAFLLLYALQAFPVNVNKQIKKPIILHTCLPM